MATGDRCWAAVAARAVGRGGGTWRAGAGAAAASEAAEPAARKKKERGKRKEMGMLSVNTYRRLNKAFH